eukprot:TRINITY_DN321_c0_g2_i2.p1 TRINITY_DN321_c0_g2~~TRINITY_DN321_c0_g2_i2.p1  ORF type:complete len:222 (+),score=28.13 TRINITY_DN321_c0_g2_i2:179-844(+)
MSLSSFQCTSVRLGQCSPLSNHVRYNTLNKNTRKICLHRYAAEEEEAVSKDETIQPVNNDKLSIPDWVPAQGADVLNVLGGTDFDVRDWSVYKEKLAKYIEADTFQKSVGWKEIPEAIHGRIAMIGIVTGLLARVLGAGSMLYQFGKFPAPVFIFVALITAASIIPVAKASDGVDLAALRSEYSLPEGVFTEANERFHGRLAMIAVSIFFLVEALSNNTLL